MVSGTMHCWEGAIISNSIVDGLVEVVLMVFITVDSWGDGDGPVIHTTVDGGWSVERWTDCLLNSERLWGTIGLYHSGWLGDSDGLWYTYI